MASINSIATAAVSALNCYTAAISVANTNIANAQTDGYTRQRTVLQATGQGGVDVSSIQRIYDGFLTRRLRSETTGLGFYEAGQETLTSVESVFTESGSSGLSCSLSDFWNSWDNVVSDPSDSSARTTLATSACTLASDLNSMSSDLSDLQNSIDDSLADCTGAINDLIDRISTQNDNITKTAGQDSNTTKDTLDELVTELSCYIGLTTQTDSSGRISISLDDGTPLLEGDTTWSFSTQTNTATGLKDIALVSKSGSTTVITDDITTGKMGACLSVRDNSIPSYQSSLNELASTLITNVNALHDKGYDLNGDKGAAFFTGSSAADIAVNSTILNDTDKIAASSTADGIPDNGTIASAIADLQNTAFFNSGTSTVSDFYAALVSKVGSDISIGKSQYEAQQTLVNSYRSQRDSVSSVSTDEEMVNLTQYQYAYEAAAKLVSVIDEIMKTLINM